MLKAEFMRCIEVTRSRNYDMRKRLSYELTDKSYILSPDGRYLSKGKRSELQSLLKARTIYIQEFSTTQPNSVALVDFIEEAGKIEARWKENNLKTFGDAVADICK